MFLQDLPPQLAEAVGVLYEQDRLASTGRRLGLPGSLIFDNIIDSRQVDLECRSAQGLAVDPDVSFALLHDAEHRRESQPGSLSRLFRGEERLKDAGLRGRVHSYAGVRDRQHDVAARTDGEVSGGVRLVQFRIAGLYRQSASLGHGVPGVDGEVHDDLLDLARVRLDVAQAVRQRSGETYVLADDAAQHPVQLPDDRVEIEDAGLQDLAAAEGEQLTCEGSCVLGRFQDLADLAPLRRRQPPEKPLTIADDDAQEVVEVVGDPARQPADGVHLLGLL